MLNPAHWGFEIVSGAIVGITISPIVKRLIKRHDRKAHTPDIRHHENLYVEIEQLRMRLWALERKSG